MASFADILRTALTQAARGVKTAVAATGLASQVFAPGTVNAFVYNGTLVQRPGSSNVHSYQFDFRRSVLAIRYNNGSTYHYFQVPQKKAELLFNSASAGKAVWDLFRVRGSRFLHQHPYLRVS